MNFKLLFTVALIGAPWVPCVPAEKVLFLFPLASKSMANVFEPLVHGLAGKGHQVTVVSPVKMSPNPNVTVLLPMTLEDFFGAYQDPFEIRKENKLFNFPINAITKCCHKVFQNKDFLALMNTKFDVVLVNAIYNDCFAGMLYKMKVPIIIFSTLPMPSPMMELYGTYQPSSFTNLPIISDFDVTPTLFQRTKNFLYNIHFNIMLDIWTRHPSQAIYREYLGQELPSIRDIYREQVALMLVNAHYSVTRPRLNLPSVVEIGGIHCQPAKPLSKDLEEFVSGAKDGFILFSLGSIVKPSFMPESVRLAFVKTFAKLKQRVIWKWDKPDGMPDAPKNVKIVNWLPQQDLLGHSNIRLFITHGGLLSTEESVYHGVPVLGLPIFVDQDSNMREAEILGIGVKGEILALTEAKVELYIRKILDEPRYATKAKELSVVFRDAPQTPLEQSIFWSEYVIRHKGAPYLRSGSVHLSLIQYHSVDVVMFLLGIAIVVLLFIYYVIKLLYVMSMRLIRQQKFNRKAKNSKSKRS